jgi:hypothetical protein
MNLRTKWLVFSPLGLTLVGFGLSLTLEAARLKNSDQPWFWLGTFGLCVVNSGLAFFGDGIKSRVLLELQNGNRN